MKFPVQFCSAVGSTLSLPPFFSFRGALPPSSYRDQCLILCYTDLVWLHFAFSYNWYLSFQHALSAIPSSVTLKDPFTWFWIFPCWTWTQEPHVPMRTKESQASSVLDSRQSTRRGQPVLSCVSASSLVNKASVMAGRELRGQEHSITSPHYLLRCISKASKLN